MEQAKKLNSLYEQLKVLWFDTLPTDKDYTKEQWDLYIDSDEFPDYPNKKYNLIYSKLLDICQEKIHELAGH